MPETREVGVLTLDDEGNWPAGCGYQGYEFGAGRYPDSMCSGGWLLDCDASDAPGMINEPSEWIPCPMCNPQAYVAHYKQICMNATTDTNSGGIKNTLSKRDAAKQARRLLQTIRRNRERGTEPWKGYRNREFIVYG
jgi:hypothetical protein